MNTINKYLGPLVLVAMMLTIVALMTFSQKSSQVVTAPTNQTLGDIGNGINDWTKFASSSAMTLTTGSAVITATSSARQYVGVVNDCTTVIYLGFDGKAAVANSGTRLNANGGSLEFDSQNLYHGAISGISPSGNCVITFLEK